MSRAFFLSKHRELKFDQQAADHGIKATERSRSNLCALRVDEADIGLMMPGSEINLRSRAVDVLNNARALNSGIAVRDQARRVGSGTHEV